MQFFAGSLSMNDLLMFIVAQVVGGYLALQVSNVKYYIKKNKY